MAGACRRAAAVVALVFVAAIGVGGAGPGPASAAAGRADGPAPQETAGSNLSVAIAPSTWWMESGTNATFAATWAGTPAGCQLDPGWYRWTIASGGSEGLLGVANGSQATFFASDQGSGSTTLVVRAVATLRCHGNVSAAFGRATATVTVAAGLAVRDLQVTPDPLAPGGTADLVGSVVGGDPPYRLRVSWGDGNVSTTNVSAGGLFEVSHAFAANGTYLPELLVTDAAGRTVTAGLEEALYVSAGFAAAIVPSVLTAELGIPVTFDVATVAAPHNFSSVFACVGAVPVGDGNTTSLTFGCRFNTVGVDPVTFLAVGSRTPFAEAYADLEEVVEGPPMLQFPAPPGVAEVGATCYAVLDVAGGVPPFTVDWSLVGTGSSGVLTLTSDGIGYLPLDPDQAGDLVLSAVAVDALGGSSPATSETVDVVPALTLYATAAATTGNGSVALNVSAGVTEGGAPFYWTIVAGTPAVNGSAEDGVLPGVGAFTWNATYRLEGTVPLTVSVVDEEGGSATVNLSVALAPALSVTANVTPVGPGQVALSLTVAGGVGPFVYRWNDSAGDRWNGTTRPGSLTIRESTGSDGALTFELTVVDALGVTASVDLAASVPSPTAAPAAAPSLATPALVAALVGAGGAVTVALRRRRPTPNLAPPDPVAVLREAIEPSDGVDRGLVEMLAEEQGVPREVVRSTLERLKAEGTVRSGRGSGGEEVLAWSDTSDR